ncbi:hypothetical protein FMUND_8909 [Fusarium mundagurra]|uniref:Acyl-CoA thioesterase-like C-terminal domain-containing protein n=1 Tax=Fusarium mundagurra TaxID=1567541 RepID=A0A8H5YG86_9HYPO|nr:hypothetical protein FMUND_8909 [Fusarium mundagurra]
MSDPPQIHDLMIVFDAVTGGTVGVAALKRAIPDIINFVALADCFERIGVLAYRNYAYTAEKVVEWSGWCYPSCDPSPPSTDDILKFVKKLEMPDDSEYKLNCASKTALAKAYQEIRKDGTIILLYNHAPPLLEHIGGDHYDSEQIMLVWYGETGPLFRNWVNGANALAGIASVKKAVVLSFSLGYADNLSDWSPYLYLSADGNIDTPPAFKTTYKDDPTLLNMVCEANMEIFCGPDYGNLQIIDIHTAPRNCLRVPYGGFSNINQQLNKFTSRDLAKNYINRGEWSKNVIAKHMNRIIRTNLSVITIHPLFGRLWAAVCMDRTGDKLNKTLMRRFRAQVRLISNAEDKRQAQAWLEGTYTFFHEINEEIQMPAEVNLWDNIPPEETKCCGFCFEEKSILIGCTNPSCAVELRMSNNERWTTWALGYIADVTPALIFEGYLPTDLDAPVPKDRLAFDKIFWMPTVSMSLDVKKALPKESEEWLSIRISAKVIENVRYDAEVIVFDREGDVLALSNHVALILDGERNWTRKDKL